MLLKTKLLISGGVIVLFSALGLIMYIQNNISKRQDAIEQGIVAQKELADKIMRSQSEYATKSDIQQFAKDNNIDIKDLNKDLKKLNAEVVSVNNIKVASVGVNDKNVKSTGNGEKNPEPLTELKCKDGVCENPDKFGYLNQEKKLKLNEPFSDRTKVPIGNVGFSAWKPNPWSINLSPREYNVTTVVATDENQRQFIYNKIFVVVDGKTYILPINKAHTKQQYPMPHFNWLNPSLNLGVAGGMYLTEFHGEILPNLGINLMSYGTYDKLPDVKILNLGVGYGSSEKNIHMFVSPILYNLGSELPLIDNFYIGPSLSVTTDGNSAIFLGVSVGL